MNDYRLQLVAVAILTAISVPVMASDTSSVSVAPTTAAATQPVAGDPGKRPVGRGPQQVEQAGKPLAPQGKGASSGLWQTVQTLGALAIVVALIFATRRLLRRFGGATIAGRSAVIEVVATSRISMRQRLLLVRLGERLVLVGSGGEPVTALAEITDADEVTRLMKLARESHAWSPAVKASSDKAGSDTGEDAL